MIFDGPSAAFVERRGQGKIALTGVHLEATTAWFEFAGLSDPENGQMVKLNHDLLDELFRD